MRRLIGRADNDLLLAMRTRGHAPRLEAAAVLLGKAGNNAGMWVVICAILALADSGDRESWVIAAALGPIAIAVNLVIKMIVRRPRPQLESLPPLGGAPSSLSFPSAHATSSFAVSVMAIRIEPLVGVPMLVLAIALSAGRPYLGMHYPSDVLAGAAFGTAIGLTIGLEL